MKANFAQQWLDILCRTVLELHSAVFILSDTVVSKNSPPLAKWPDTLKDFSGFLPIVKYVLKKNKPVVIPNVQQPDLKQFDFYALPVFAQAELFGIVILKVQHLPNDQHPIILKKLSDGTHWLELANSKPKQDDEFYASVLSLLAASFEQKNYRETLVCLITELTLLLNCERIAVGEFKDHHSTIVAVSNSAQLDVRTNFLQKIADAMDEAIEQDSLIVFPNAHSTVIQRAHQELARKFGSGALLTLPMAHDESMIGAITLLRSEENPFDKTTIKLCQQAISLITPYLTLIKADERPITTRIAISVKKHVAGIIGFKHFKIKLAVAGLITVVLLSTLLKGDFFVTADADLEGKMQRVIAAPISGFLVSAAVRAGDTVRRGDLMASLDDSELQLEISKLNGQLQKSRREYREALSTGDLVKVRVISAQIDQATAALQLTQQQLQKINLTAPFDSIVIEGDLSQMLGSPVERGDKLFKIAPLEGYRIILKVDERLISYIKTGQKGTLALSGMPDKKLDLTVDKITAVASSENNASIFRVEAGLKDAPATLRPGMEGIGKVKAGRARLIWIWTHQLVDWLRLWLWSWWF